MNFRGEAAFATNSKDVSVWKLVGLETDKTLQRVRRVERNTSKPESITVLSVCLAAQRQNNQERHVHGGHRGRHENGRGNVLTEGLCATRECRTVSNNSGTQLDMKTWNAT